MAEQQQQSFEDNESINSVGTAGTGGGSYLSPTSATNGTFGSPPSPNSAKRQKELIQKSITLRKMSAEISQNLQNMATPTTNKKNALGSTPSVPSQAGEEKVSLPTLPSDKTKPLLEELNIFLTHHLSFHRPVALVTSGGTITTLEQNTIRYLDNFSTGQRGAISVEEFCKRGYAVIHLWRKGSTAPYSRVLSKLLGCKQGNHALDFHALGLLFEGQGDSDTFEKKVQKKQQNEGVSQKNHDPWLTATKRSKNYPSNNLTSSSTKYHNDSKYSTQSRMNLTTHVLHNNLLQRKLRERANVISNNLLFTIPFTTIEEYIALLKVTTEAMDQCQSLGLIYLAAAVSDFYIPEEEKCVHKIQSRDYGLKSSSEEKSSSATSPIANSIAMNKSDNTLSLTLYPVPKVIHQIRKEWSPHAYCVSFKLETDETILRQKVSQAMKKYDVHMVIGNILQTRHDQVLLFAKHQDEYGVDVTNVTKSHDGDGDDDELEDKIISHVVEKHFEYIANHYLLNDDSAITSNGGAVIPRTALMTGAEAAARHRAQMRKKKESMKNELKMKRLRDISLNVIGHALGCYLTYTLSSAIQKRF